jgi:hypothetical protein
MPVAWEPERAPIGRAGPFDLLKRLGAGEMGVVFRAVHRGNRYDRAMEHDSPRSTEEAWAKARGAWPGFEFMWEHGCTHEEIAAAEAWLGIHLPERVRALAHACAGAGFPTCAYGAFTVETCFDHVRTWKTLAGSGLLAEGMDWPEERVRQNLVIGHDPWGDDYGMYMLLDVASGEVRRLTLNIPDAQRAGDVERWVGDDRLGGKEKKSPLDVYRSDDMTPQEIAERHRSYLGDPHRKERWGKIEARFIAAVEKLREGR